jgi:hypothetical protein
MKNNRLRRISKIRKITMDIISKNFCKCGSERQYSNRYDAYYCELCNKWIDDKCTNPECEFCSKRPDKPSQCEQPTTKYVNGIYGENY